MNGTRSHPTPRHGSAQHLLSVFLARHFDLVHTVVTGILKMDIYRNTAARFAGVVSFETISVTRSGDRFEKIKPLKPMEFHVISVVPFQFIVYSHSVPSAAAEGSRWRSR